MVGTLVSQLMGGATAKDFDMAGVGAYYIDNGNSVFPESAGGHPFSAGGICSKNDAIANLVNNMAAEQKARATYDNILRMSDDPDVSDVIKFLREREVVHFQRFGEALNSVQNKMMQKNFFMKKD